MHNDLRQRKLGIEPLEARTLLAGNVTATVVDGSLWIRGDNQGNSLVIEASGQNPGEYRITGDDGTSINGAGEPVVISGVTRDVLVQLKGGDDRLELDGINTARDVRIDPGTGDDEIFVESATIGRDFHAFTRAGDDSVYLLATLVERRTLIHTAAGNDLVALDDSTFKDALSVRTFAGDDVLFGDSTFLGRVAVNAGPGRNSLTTEGPEVSFDFRDGAAGWEAGFSDYPAGEEEFYELESGLRPLPPELGVEGTGFYIQGNNHSDELFMFLKKQLGQEQGIVPNQTYLVRLSVTFASNAPSNCWGIGGSPGESVYLKAGATDVEPVPVDDGEGFLWLNVDKGHQSSGGPAATVVGNIANGVPCDEALPPGEGEIADYVSVERTHVHEFVVQADENGELWLLIGTDSAFEGTTALYYQQVDAQFIPIANA